MDNAFIVKGEWIFSKIKCFIINIYALQDKASKLSLWNLINAFMLANLSFYIFLGDFNVVRSVSESLGTVFLPNPSHSFNDFIHRSRL